MFFSEALIDDINIDIQQATASMDQEKFKIFSENALFKEVTDSQKLWFIHFVYRIYHGSMGSRVSKRGVQSYMDFWPKINIHTYSN